MYRGESHHSMYKDYKIFMGKDDGKSIMETLFEGG